MCIRRLLESVLVGLSLFTSSVCICHRWSKETDHLLLLELRRDFGYLKQIYWMKKKKKRIFCSLWMCRHILYSMPCFSCSQWPTDSSYYIFVTFRQSHPIYILLQFFCKYGEFTLIIIFVWLVLLVAFVNLQQLRRTHAWLLNLAICNSTFVGVLGKKLKGTYVDYIEAIEFGYRKRIPKLRN